MWKRIALLIGFAISLFLVFSLGVVAAGIPEHEKISAVDPPPVVVRTHLSDEPVFLDPALALNSNDLTVVEQLFLGLVDLNEATGAVEPQLATTWTVSADHLVYTFTLRNDAFWSDGTPITAQDVEYGILRTLTPETAANGGYVYANIIKNGDEYYHGTITDTSKVGVSAINTSTLRITLDYPASHAPTILSMWGARPMPRWAIEAHGVPTWTFPANIVTSGPYVLTEWRPDYLLLDKNPLYYDAETAQIDQIRMVITDTFSAQQMYLQGNLDIAQAPYGPLSPILEQELHIQPRNCVYYYGFNSSLPPFNDPLVRRAFSAATDRVDLMEVVYGYNQPAVTFTPAGVFGHIDGYSENVGLPYDAQQAQQWLASAGYSPEEIEPITLTYNSSLGHERIARYVRDSWYDTLGVSVTLQALPWGDYLTELSNGRLQVWRLSWCNDFPEARNFLGDSVFHNKTQLGNWSNPQYDQLLYDSAREHDENARRELYKQAEEILVENDAVLLPLYHYGRGVTTKPYLERSYWLGALSDIESWQMTFVQQEITTEGGGFLSYDGNTHIAIPPGVISNTILITHTPASALLPGGTVINPGPTFRIIAVYQETGKPASLLPSTIYTLAVQYDDTALNNVAEKDLDLYRWDAHSGWWTSEGINSEIDSVNNRITAQVSDFSLFTVLGGFQRIYLPLVTRTY
jgi:oligopeptide transport system substrate-binding protein